MKVFWASLAVFGAMFLFSNIWLAIEGEWMQILPSVLILVFAFIGSVLVGLVMR